MENGQKERPGNNARPHEPLVITVKNQYPQHRLEGARPQLVRREQQ